MSAIIRGMIPTRPQRTKRVEGLGGDLNRALAQGVLDDAQKAAQIWDEILFLIDNRVDLAIGSRVYEVG